MGHDQTTYQSCADTPTGGPHKFFFVILILEGHFKSLGEVLTQIMTGSSLKCFGITHHGFNGIGTHCTSKFF